MSGPSAPKKSLGQHWLNDPSALDSIVKAADLHNDETVLEIGPGQGSLTLRLVKQAGKVVAVEIDKQLINRLRNLNLAKLEIVHEDIRHFDLAKLPRDYKVVANIPYYLTSNLVRLLSESAHPPKLMVLLVQKEVAQRIATAPGQMSLLAVSAQLYYQPKLGKIISADLFIPPPKVDSQIVALARRDQPLFGQLDTKIFFRLVKAGFSEKRKKLRSSLAGGLNISREEADRLLKTAGIKSDSRAQELSLEQWHSLYQSSKIFINSLP